MKKQRRQFDTDFKLDMVCMMIEEQGLSISHVSESMSISRITHRSWGDSI